MVREWGPSAVPRTLPRPSSSFSSSSELFSAQLRAEPLSLACFFSLYFIFYFFFPYFSLFSFTFRFFAGAPRLACSRPYCLRAARGRGGERPPAVCPGCCGGGSTRTHPQKYTNTRRSTQTHAYIHTNTPPGWPPASLLAIQPIDVLLGGGEINKTSSFADATLYLSLFGFC